MAIWGALPFENDDAVGFLAEVREDGPVALEEAFDVVLDEEEYLEAPEGARAVAAAAILGAILTGERGDVPPEAAEWLAQQRPEAVETLRAPALTVLDRVAADGSELFETWEDGDDLDAWLAALERTRAALVL